MGNYDYEHEQTRKRLLPEAYGKACPMCGEVMLKGQDLHLDHSVPLAEDPNSRGDRIVHQKCNTSAGGRLAQKIEKYRPSRDWLK